MASFLYRFTLTVIRRAKLVLVAWLVALFALGGLAVALGGQLQDDFSIPGAESQKGLDLLDERFPQLSGSSAQVLITAPAGKPVTEFADQISQIVATLGSTEHVAGANDPFDPQTPTISPSGQEALILVQLDVPTEGVTDDLRSEIQDAAQAPSDSGLTVDVGGDAYAATGVHLSIVEALGVAVALLVLVITLGSMVAAGLPILSALLGIGVAMTAVLVASSWMNISTTTPTLALMIGLAVGIDYALFLIARHRHELALGGEVKESIARSVGTAGSAVVFAGATVIIALCGLVVAGIPFLSIMGFAAAFAVLIAVFVVLTAVPAFLALAGERLRPKPGSRAHNRELALSPDNTAHTMGSRWVGWVTKAPALAALASVVFLAILAIPAKDLALGLSDNGSAEPGTSERVTYDRVSESFGEGFNSPLLVIAEVKPEARNEATLRTEVATLAGVLGKLDGVQGIGLASPNQSGDLVVVQIIPATSKDDPATSKLVNEIRDNRADLSAATPGLSNLQVTGHTAVAIDVSHKLSDAILPFGIVVVGLSLILLTIVFRSIAVPIKASLGYVLSVAASFGVVAAVFEWGWAADLLDVSKVGPVVAFLPIMVMGVLFGLAMDYEVFLVSRIREHYVHTGKADEAIRVGFAASARVVTAAALIMFAVFAAFVPAGDPIIKPMALALASGVLLDAFIVRMTFGPAVLALLGQKAWWLPRWLDRILPSVDIEGTSLEKKSSLSEH